MKVLSIIAIASTLAVSSAAFADGADLVKKNGCIGCHDAVAKKVGPSWKDIAAKEKGNPDVLAEAIVKGSKGKYGKIPMPPQARAASDAKAIADWILTH